MPCYIPPRFPGSVGGSHVELPAEPKRNDCRSGHSDRCECASFPLAAIPTLFRAHLKCSRPSDVSFVSDCILVGSAQLRRTWLRSRLPSLPWSAAPEGFALDRAWPASMRRLNEPSLRPRVRRCQSCNSGTGSTRSAASGPTCDRIRKARWVLNPRQANADELTPRTPSPSDADARRA